MERPLLVEFKLCEFRWLGSEELTVMTWGSVELGVMIAAEGPVLLFREMYCGEREKKKSL